jgi:hypothetical protein
LDAVNLKPDGNDDHDNRPKQHKGGSAMNDTNTDPRTEYIRRLQDMWKGAPPDENNDGNGNTSTPRHNDGHDDDPRAAYVRRLVGDGVPYFGDGRLNDSGSNRVPVNDGSEVVQFHDHVTITAGWTKQTNLTLGDALRQIRQQRQCERILQGGVA